MRTPGGLVLSGRTSGHSTGLFEECPDQDPTPNTWEGCAFFLPISEPSLAPGTPFVLDSDGTAFGGDQALGGWLTPDGGDLLLAGTADGALTILSTPIPAPPAGYMNLYFARVHLP